jgi:hypothetical protein
VTVIHESKIWHVSNHVPIHTVTEASAMIEPDSFCDFVAIFELDCGKPTKSLHLTRSDIGRKSNLLNIADTPGVLDFSKELDSMKGAILRSFYSGKVEMEDHLLSACCVAMKKYNFTYDFTSLSLLYSQSFVLYVLIHSYS